MNVSNLITAKKWQKLLDRGVISKQECDDQLVKLSISTQDLDKFKIQSMSPFDRELFEA